jgi:hypothetical protein
VKVNYSPTDWLKIYDVFLIQDNHETASTPNQGYGFGGADKIFGQNIIIPANNPYNTTGEHPTLEGSFRAAREQPAQRVEANPDDVQLLSVLGAIDALLGQKQQALEEATRAEGLQRRSPDALQGREILGKLIDVYIWTNELDLAFEKLAVLIKTPPLVAGRAVFGQDPELDPIRKDPRFDKLIAQIPTYP